MPSHDESIAEGPAWVAHVFAQFDDFRKAGRGADARVIDQVRAMVAGLEFGERPRCRVEVVRKSYAVLFWQREYGHISIGFRPGGWTLWRSCTSIAIEGRKEKRGTVGKREIEQAREAFAWLYPEFASGTGAGALIKEAEL